jgi:integrase
MVRYKAANGTWLRALAVYGANGRIRPGYAQIDGKPAAVTEFKYQVRHYEQRQVRYTPAGRNAADAETLRRRIGKQTTAKAVAQDAGLKVEAEETRKNLKNSATDYVANAEERGATEAAVQARHVTNEFLVITKKSYVDEVTQSDILRFHAALRKRGCSDRTVANKHQRLSSWLRFAGVKGDVLTPSPRYEKKLPTIYESDEISTILAEADPYMHLLIGLAMKCGLREQELVHLEWADVDEAAKVVKVRGKLKYDFKVKDSEQREVSIPDDLLKELKSWKMEHPRCSLVLGTASDNPNYKMLRALKRLARRAGLNCERCSGCKGSQRECHEWTLQRFRRTYCTTILRSGVDLRTAQALMGHSDLASTMRYLRPAADEALQAKLSAIRW